VDLSEFQFSTVKPLFMQEARWLDVFKDLTELVRIPFPPKLCSVKKIMGRAKLLAQAIHPRNLRHIIKFCQNLLSLIFKLFGIARIPSCRPYC
jgi:hypothetical protein